MSDETRRRTTRVLAIDQRPGVLPEITAEGPSIAYVLALAGARDNTRLVLRCDGAGEIWVSIRRSE